MVDQLLDFTTVRQIRKALETQPSGLDEAFESSLKRIDSHPKPKRMLARRLVGWITYAKRRLKLDEILYAFAVEEDSEVIHQESLPNPDLLLRLCVGLVMLDEKDNTLGLCHASAYEFFQNSVLSATDIEVDIAKTCLHYLSMRSLREGRCQNSIDMLKRLQQMPFLAYSARYWGNHLQAKDAEKHLKL